jgi:hypothetical protein
LERANLNPLGEVGNVRKEEITSIHLVSYKCPLERANLNPLIAAGNIPERELTSVL